MAQEASRRPEEERRAVPREFVNLPAEMGCGLSSTLEPVAVREISPQGLCMLAYHGPGTGSEIYIYMNTPHPGGRGFRRVRYTATVRRIDEVPGKKIFIIAAIIRRCEVLLALSDHDAETSPQAALAVESPSSRSLAIRNRQSRRQVPDAFVSMGTVRCDNCGEEFFICHYSASADLNFAQHQAYWFERLLADEHKQKKTHSDLTELPE